MVLVPITILGGLPVIADVWFTQGDGWMTDDDAGVDVLYWRRRNGAIGKEISGVVLERVQREDYWEAYVTEQANDWLGCNCPTRYRDKTVRGGWREEGSYSEEYILLNGNPRLKSPTPADASTTAIAPNIRAGADAGQGSSK